MATYPLTAAPLAPSHSGPPPLPSSVLRFASASGSLPLVDVVMTSLVSPPHILLSLSYDCELSISLYNVWRVTSSKNLVCKHSSTRRLNNRTWRLMSEKIVCSSERKLDKSLLTLKNTPLTTVLRDTARKLTERPSLFLNNSKSTAESQLSLHNNSIRAYDSGDDTSDISEDDEEYQDEEIVAPPQLSLHSNYLGKSTVSSPPSASSLISNSLSHGPGAPRQPGSRPDLAKNNIFYILNSPSPPQKDPTPSPSDTVPEKGVAAGPIQRQDSLFGPNNTFSAAANNLSSLSSSDISEDDENYDDLTDGEDEMDDAFHNANYAKQRASISAASKRSTKSTRSGDDNESEWVSISSDSEQVTALPRPKPLTFAKRIPVKSNASPSFHLSSLGDEKKYSPSLSKPRSLLSGMLFNEMAATTNSSPTSARSAQGVPLPPKPVLKRSSTTGVITVDKNGKAGETKSMLKPSIFFSKRYGSLSDIQKKVSSYRSPVLYVEEEDSTREGDVRVPEENADALFAKQTSSVGLSDFIATGNSTTNLNSLSLKNRRSPAPDRGSESTLSSSLSKYSSLYPGAGGSSFKSMLSKSSLNISSLFQNKGNRLRLGRSSETLKSPTRETFSPLFGGFMQEHHTRESPLPNPKETSSTKSIKVAPKPMKDFCPLVQVSESLKDSLMIDHKLGKVPLPERVISDEDLFRGRNRDEYLEDSYDDYHSKGW